MATISTLLSLAKRFNIYLLDELLSHNEDGFSVMPQAERMRVIRWTKEVVSIIGEDAFHLMRLLMNKQLSDEESVYAVRVIIKLRDPCWTMRFVAKFGLKLPDEKYVNAVYGMIKQGYWTGSLLKKFGSKLPNEAYVYAFLELIKQKIYDEFRGKQAQYVDVLLFRTKSFLAEFGSKLPDEVVMYAIRTIIKLADAFWIETFLGKFGSKLPAEEYADAVRTVIQQDDLSSTEIFLEKFGSKLSDGERLYALRTIIKQGDPFSIQHFLEKFGWKLLDQECLDAVRAIAEQSGSYLIERWFKETGYTLPESGYKLPAGECPKDAVNKIIEEHAQFWTKELWTFAMKFQPESFNEASRDEFALYIFRDIMKTGAPFSMQTCSLIEFLLEEYGSKLPAEEYVDAVRVIIKQGDPSLTEKFLEKFDSKLPEGEYLDALCEIIKQLQMKEGAMPHEEYVDALRGIIKQSRIKKNAISHEEYVDALLKQLHALVESSSKLCMEKGSMQSNRNI
jgi:hypothetical protein